jgi:hypothetical protein
MLVVCDVYQQLRHGQPLCSRPPVHQMFRAGKLAKKKKKCKTYLSYYKLIKHAYHNRGHETAAAKVYFAFNSFAQRNLFLVTAGCTRDTTIYALTGSLEIHPSSRVSSPHPTPLRRLCTTASSFVDKIVKQIVTGWCCCSPSGWQKPTAPASVDHCSLLSWSSASTISDVR